MKVACWKENCSKILLKIGLLGAPENSRDEKWESWDYSKTKIWENIYKMGFGAIIFKIKGWRNGRWHMAQMWPCKGGPAMRLDAWIVAWSNNGIVGLCSSLGSQSNNDLSLDTRDALSKENMPLSWVVIILNRLTRRDQVSTLKLYWLGMLNIELPTHNNPTSFRSTFHNKNSEHYSEPFEQQVL